MTRVLLPLLLGLCLHPVSAAPVRAAAGDGFGIFYLEFDDAGALHGVAPLRGHAMLGLDRDGAIGFREGDCRPAADLERAGMLRGVEEVPPRTRVVLACPLGEGAGLGGHFFYAARIDTEERRLLETKDCRGSLPRGGEPLLLQLMGHQYMCWEDWSNVADPKAEIRRLLQKRRAAE